MTLYGGIDLHATTSVVVLLDEPDRVVYQTRLSNYVVKGWGWSRPITGPQLRRNFDPNFLKLFLPDVC